MTDAPLVLVPERRSPQGTILRSALDEVQRVAAAAGKTHATVLVFDAAGVQIGFARRDPDGWEISSALKAGVKRGRFSDVRAQVEMTW